MPRILRGQVAGHAYQMLNQENYGATVSRGGLLCILRLQPQEVPQKVACSFFPFMVTHSAVSATPDLFLLIVQ